jgi:LacI family transcriptional regulator
MRRKIVTIRDVAQHAGVSVSTVSHVLNGNAQHVGAIKRARVLQSMDELRYRPNAIARSMVKQKTATIGLVLTEIDNPLFTPVIAGINEVLRPAGYHIVLASAPDIENEMQAIETLRSQQVDGFIFMSVSLRYPSEHLTHLRDESVPFVVINRYLEDSEINQVLWDDYGVGYTATRYLLSLGHRRIGTITGPIYNTPPRRSANERHRGWQQALEEQGIAVPREWIFVGNYTYQGGYQATKALLEQAASKSAYPSALFVANDAMALGTLKALYEAGLRVPDDISVIAAGDPPFGSYTIPALTTLSLPIREAGQVAARILLDWLMQGKAGSAQQINLNFSLQIRETCGPYQEKNMTNHKTN